MKRPWAPFLVLAVPILGPSLAILSSSTTPNLFFETLFSKSLALYLVCVAAWLVTAGVVPKIEAPGKRAKSLVVGVFLSFPIFVAGLALWLEAVDIHAMKNIPVVDSGAQLKAQWETPWGRRALGIFVSGKLKGPEQGEPPSLLTHYPHRNGGPTGYFPLTLQMVLPDGEEIEISCIQQVGKAVGWPEVEMSFSRGLREGDAVIVWGDPAKFQAMGSGLESYGVQETRALIYGPPEKLKESFVEPARRSAKPVGWMALIVALFSWLPAAFAWRLSQAT